MDMNMDKGTTKLVNTPDGPLLVESHGFPVIVVVDTQDQARAVKAEMRERGFQAQYDNPIVVPV